jgi:hypothetical protein
MSVNSFEELDKVVKPAEKAKEDPCATALVARTKEGEVRYPAAIPYTPITRPIVPYADSGLRVHDIDLYKRRKSNEYRPTTIRFPREEPQQINILGTLPDGKGHLIAMVDEDGIIRRRIMSRDGHIGSVED